QNLHAFAELIPHGRLDGLAKTATLSAAIRQGEIFFDGEIFAGAGHGVLKNPRDALGTFPDRLGRDILAVNGDGTAVYGQITGYGVQKRGFSRAVGSDHRNELSGRNVQ